MVIGLLLPVIVVGVKLRWSPKFPEIDAEILSESPLVNFAMEEELSFDLS